MFVFATTLFLSHRVRFWIWKYCLLFHVWGTIIDPNLRWKGKFGPVNLLFWKFWYLAFYGLLAAFMAFLLKPITFPEYFIKFENFGLWKKIWPLIILWSLYFVFQEIYNMYIYIKQKFIFGLYKVHWIEIIYFGVKITCFAIKTVISSNLPKRISV